MTNAWFPALLRDCAEFQEGYVNPSQKVSSYFDGDVKWLRAVDLNDGYVYETSRMLSKKGFESAGKSALLFEPETLAISKSGTIGRVGILKDYMCGNRAVINIKVKQDKCSTLFIFYVLLGNRPLIEELAIGSVQRNLYASALGSLEFRLPPICEQQAIAEILSSLDEKIELNRKQNSTLEAIAQALFKRWFVEFEFPDENGQPYRSSDGAMQPSELGEIPVGWEAGTFGDEFEIIMGQSPSGDTYNDIGEGMVFFQGRTDFGFRFPNIRIYCTDPKKKASKGDVLLSVRAPVGDLNIAFEDCCIGRGLAAVKSNNKSYVFYKLKYAYPVFQVFESEGTVFGSISKTGIVSIESVIPPNSLVQQFDSLVQLLDKKIECNTSEIRTLSKLRDSLLPKLMSGELRVADAREMTEAMA